MILIYKLLAAGAILVAALVAGFFYGKIGVTKQWEADKAVWTANYDKQVAETARVQAAWNTTKEQNDAWKAKADAAGADAVSVARSLRDYKARAGRCAVSAVAPDTGEPGSPGAQPDDIGRLEESHFAACAADASDYDAFRAWYNGLRQAQ